MVTAPEHRTLAKLCLQEILAACRDSSQITPILYGLEGDVHIVSAAGKNFTVKIPSFHRDKKPDEKMKEFLETLALACKACPNLVTLESEPEQCEKCMGSSPPLKRPSRGETSEHLVGSAKRKPYFERETATSTTTESPTSTPNRKASTPAVDTTILSPGQIKEEKIDPILEDPTTPKTSMKTSMELMELLDSPINNSNLASPIIPNGSISDWKIEDVIQYISSSDSSLAVHADLFRRHVSSINKNCHLKNLNHF